MTKPPYTLCKCGHRFHGLICNICKTPTENYRKLKEK